MQSTSMDLRRLAEKSLEQQLVVATDRLGLGGTTKAIVTLCVDTCMNNPMRCPIYPCKRSASASPQHLFWTEPSVWLSESILDDGSRPS